MAWKQYNSVIQGTFFTCMSLKTLLFLSMKVIGPHSLIHFLFINWIKSSFYKCQMSGKIREVLRFGGTSWRFGETLHYIISESHEDVFPPILENVSAGQCQTTGFHRIWRNHKPPPKMGKSATVSCKQLTRSGSLHVDTTFCKSCQLRSTALMQVNLCK